MPVVVRYDEGYDWRYVVRSAHGQNAGANLDRRGEVWRYRRTLPADLRDRAGQTEITRGLGRIALAEVLAEAQHLNAQVDEIFQVARSNPQADLALALAGVRKGARPLPGPEDLYGSMQVISKYRPQKPESRAPRLAEAIDHYEREQWAAGRWKAEKAGHAAMAELRKFAEFVGDLPLGEVSREDVRAYRDHRGETLRASTLNIKVMSRLVSFFRHCQEEGWIAKLPTNGLRVRDPIANRDKRRAFTLAELRRVFGPGWKRECKGDDHKFHCGRLLLATGARAEEIAQLRVDDVTLGKGILSIRITDEHPEQRLKNAASRRTVPLHSAVAPSFRRYVRKVEREGHEWVFHRWSRTPTQPRSSPIVTTFGLYLRQECGIADRRVVLHSLRHTIKQQLQEAGAPDSLISDLLGHAGQGQTNGTYGEAATVERMTAWVERLPLASVLASA